jgi:hypothetical protein
LQNPYHFIFKSKGIPIIDFKPISAAASFQKTLVASSHYPNARLFPIPQTFPANPSPVSKIVCE